MTIKNTAHQLWLGLVLGGSLAAMSAAAQEASVGGSVEAGRAKSATCAACHGADGNSVTPDWPMLAGQHATYIVRQLQAFKNGERTDVTMKPFADLLSEQDMLDVAAYFEAKAPIRSSSGSASKSIAAASPRAASQPASRATDPTAPAIRSQRIRASATSTPPTRPSS
jgi:cytochrome c553